MELGSVLLLIVKFSFLFVLVWLPWLAVCMLFFKLFYFFIFREEMNERFERAAAIAVFQGDIKLAISSLREGAAVSFNKKGSDSSSSKFTRT